MARRRYLSTTISTDKAVNRLAMQYGDFAALLYTWLIPHAADDCSFPADPEELMMIVMPGRRDKEPEDIQAAIDAMLTEGLILHDREKRNALMFPPKSFYGHQTYIKEDRQRKTPQNSAIPESAGDMPQDSASRAPAPSSVSSSVSHSPSVSETTERASAPPPPKKPSPIAFEIAETLKQAPWVGDELAIVAAKIDESAAKSRAWFDLARDGPLLALSFVNCKAYRKKPPSLWYSAWLNWLRKERDDAAKATANGSGRTDPASQTNGVVGTEPFTSDPKYAAYFRH